jgi:adenylylsulfate kinase
VQVPNITHIFYGRDVGDAVERIVLDADVEEISATGLRSDTGSEAERQYLDPDKRGRR